MPTDISSCREFKRIFQESEFFYCNTFQIVLLYLGCRKWQPEYPGVAQMVARLNGVQEAAGSNPVTRTKTLKSVMISAFSFYSLLKNGTLDF